MRVRFGDLWQRHPAQWVVVPTNIGWRADGTGILGAGVAKQAADRFPELSHWWGWYCRTLLQDTPVVCHPQYRVILFPTKPLDAARPHLSWRQNSDLGLIWRSSAQLAAILCDGEIALPLVGCGNGNLAAEVVLPVLREFLSNSRFELVAQAEFAPLIDGVLNGAWGNYLVHGDPRPGCDGRPRGVHFWRDH